MIKYAKLIDEKDNVVSALDDVISGEEVTVKYRGNERECVRCNQDVPFGHKIAIIDIANGEKIVKYGETIGITTQSVTRGDWVHTHNVKDNYRVLDKQGNPLPGQGD